MHTLVDSTSGPTLLQEALVRPVGPNVTDRKTRKWDGELVVGMGGEDKKGGMSVIRSCYTRAWTCQRIN